MQRWKLCVLITRMTWKSTAISTALAGLTTLPFRMTEYLMAMSFISTRGWGDEKGEGPFEKNLGEEVFVVLDGVDHQLCDPFAGLHSEAK